MRNPVDKNKQPRRRYARPTLVKREKLDRIVAATGTSLIRVDG